MKLTIEDYCIRCMICQTLYPELFELDFNNDVIRLKVDDIPEALMEKAKESIKDCAVGAIHSTK